MGAVWIVGDGKPVADREIICISGTIEPLGACAVLYPTYESGHMTGRMNAFSTEIYKGSARRASRTISDTIMRRAMFSYAVLFYTVLYI